MKSQLPDPKDRRRRKGICPYEFVDGISKLEHVGRPPKAAFVYSTWKNARASDEYYQHALAVHNALLCELFRDVHLVYLATDVLLLADLFENFRNTGLTYYELDFSNYLSLLGMAWDAMLIKTGAKLRLITVLKTCWTR